MHSKPILIHTHFHRRRTGLTRSIENVFSYFGPYFDCYIFGYGIEGRKISFLKILKLVLSKQYFVLHCHRNNEMMRALIFRFIGGNFKLISTRHAESAPSGLTNYLLKKSDVVVTLTNGMQSNLTYESMVVGHGVEVKKFKPNTSQRRNEIVQDKILTCAGRIRMSKGQKRFLETFGPILKKYPEWAMVFVGRVDKKEFLHELKRIVSENEIENQVYFIDETPDIISFYQASHTVVVPSFSEGFSLVCAEAMACGCNLLATKGVGVHSDIIKDGENGYLFDFQNDEQLSEILISLCEGELKHLGENARTTILKSWSAEIEAKNLMDIYKS